MNFRLPTFTAALSLLLLSNAPPLQAQQKTVTQSMLALPVDLELGATTVGEAVREIARQTRLKARATDALKPRRVTVSMRGVSAAHALDALAELNDWRWYETAPGEVLLTRRRPAEIRQVADVAPALQAALPPDLRRFAGLGLKEEDLPPPPAIYQRDYDSMQRHPSPEDFAYRLGWRLEAAVLRNQAALIGALEPALSDGRELPTAKLPQARQRNLLAVLVFGMLRALGSGSNFNVLHNRLAPFVTNPALAGVSLLNEHTMMIGPLDTLVGSFGGTPTELKKNLPPQPEKGP